MDTEKCHQIVSFIGKSSVFIITENNYKMMTRKRNTHTHTYLISDLLFDNCFPVPQIQVLCISILS